MKAIDGVARSRPSGLSFIISMRHELERERLVGEPDLRDRERPGLRPPLLDHADLVDPEPATGLRVIHVQDDVSDSHERLPERGASTALTRSRPSI